MTDTHTQECTTCGGTYSKGHFNHEGEGVRCNICNTCVGKRHGNITHKPTWQGATVGTCTSKIQKAERHIREYERRIRQHRSDIEKQRLLLQTLNGDPE